MAKARGQREIRLGGHNHVVRFRSLEIAELEDELGGKNIIDVFQKQEIGLKFLIKALKVGLKHEYSGKKGKRAVLTDEKIAGWVDDSEDFVELLQNVVEAVADGLPIQFDLDEDEEEEEATPGPLELDENQPTGSDGASL